MRTDRGEEEQKILEERAEQSIQEERESFRKNEEKWVFSYRDSGNWNNKPRITCLSFSGGVKVIVSHTV